MKNYTKKSLKASSGITLIALVITIIVLLILAGISISMLTGNNSILQKAPLSKEKTDRAEIIETAQMDILGKQAENQGSLSEQELIEILTSNDYNTKGTLSDEESILDKNLTSRDGKYTIPVSEIYNGTFSPVDLTSIIDYGNKTASTVDSGDDITIGTEKFKILKKQNGTIYALAYYNLVLSSNPIVQATAENAGTGEIGNAGGIAFAEYDVSWASPYNVGRDLDMDADENNVQQFIKAYQTTLKNRYGVNIKTRIPTGADMLEVTEPYSFQSTVNLAGNPSGVGSFWLGTRDYYPNRVLYVYKGYIDGYTDDSPSVESDWIGVRPIIEITI